MKCLAWLMVSVCISAMAAAQPAGQGLLSPLFDLREMDMHLHAGLEREVGLNEWLDLAAKDGRKVVVLLDHIELYRKTQKAAEEWAKGTGHALWYPTGAEGHQALMRDFDEARAARKDLLLFKGWEIAEFELDEGLEEAPMAMAEVIGWHISPNAKGVAPDGRLLVKRIRQIQDAQRRFPVPMIVYHPFPMRLEHLVAQAKKEGRGPESLTVEACRYFQPGEQEELIGLLRGASIYIEMSRATEAYWNYPNMREALIADIKPLADAGVQFIVSTDNHSVQHAKKPFDPEPYCAPCGITPSNTNSLVRELLDLRTKRALMDK